MAPALTEAATQAKIKLPESDTTPSTDLADGQNIHKITHKEIRLQISRENFAKITKPYGTFVVSPSVGLRFGLTADSWQGSDTDKKSNKHTPTILSKPREPPNNKNLTTDGKNSFQNEFIKSIRPLTRPVLSKVPQIMNRPSAGLDNAEEKCHGQIGTHKPPLSADVPLDKRAVANTSGESGVPGQTEISPIRPAGNLPHTIRSNMCRKQGGKRVPDRPTNTNNSSEASRGESVQSNGQRQVTSTTRLAAGQNQSLILSSPDSNCDGERVDEGVQKAYNEAGKKQAQLERKFEFHQRRLRRLQARQVEQHTQKQLNSYVAHQYQNLQTVAKTINPNQLSENSCDLKKELLSDGVKNLSTAALVNLVHKFQASNSFPQHPQSIKQEVTTNVLTMSEDVRLESKATAEKMVMNLHFMQAALDSDATESSSGGESGEEDAVEGKQFSLSSTPLLRRAEWKWAYDRAAVASKWTWLQAQVSDLEYRIRQQSELYRQARHTKGPVLLGEPPAPQEFLSLASQLVGSSSGEARTGAQSLRTMPGGTEVSPLPVSALMSNVDKQASRLTQSLGNCLSPANTSPASSVSSSRPKSGQSSPGAALNGLIDSPLSTASVDVEGCSPSGISSESRLATESIDLSPVLDPTCRAARCLPLKQPLRKRILLRTRGLHLRSAKAARLSSVKCRCHPLVTPCVLCSGRLNMVQTVDSISMPFQERVGLLDHSYHQVLSFKEEVPLSVRFEALLRSGDWQNKSSVRRTRAEPSQRRQKNVPNLTDGRKKPFRKQQASVIIQSAKIRNKYEQKTGRKPGPPRGKRLGQKGVNSELKLGKDNSAFELKGKNVKGTREFQGSAFDTPATSPLTRDANSTTTTTTPAGTQKEKEVRKRRGESAYDINNIIIPHSMASLTRVRKLEYKEIPLPSWRIVTDTEDFAETTEDLDHTSNGLIIPQDHVEEEIEDLSDEGYIQRHLRCEMQEKKNFSNIVRFPPSRRARSHLQSAANLREPSHSTPSRPATPNLPTSMGTQASLDMGDFGDDSEDVPLLSSIQSPRSSTPFLHGGLSEDDNNPLLNISGVSTEGTGTSRRGSFSASQPERLNLCSSVDEQESDGMVSIKPWPPRKFPLSDEEVALLNESASVEEKSSRSLCTVPSITSLRPQPVDGGSQVGSSVSGSLPPSPMPSTSSASVAGDIDATDPEWFDESISKKNSSQNKSVKR